MVDLSTDMKRNQNRTTAIYVDLYYRMSSFGRTRPLHVAFILLILSDTRLINPYLVYNVSFFRYDSPCS